jgi:ceramide glucosyltransferase
MLLTWFLGILVALSLGLAAWQFVVAMRFPLHRRLVPPRARPDGVGGAGSCPVTLLKPLKGSDSETAGCLRSWLRQDYPGEVQVLFGVASAEDPVCELVRELIAAHPQLEAQLVICPEPLGTNAKVSTLAQLERLARHDVLVISDADVRVPPDLLSQLAAQLAEPGVALVNCFYRLASPANLPMRLEAIAINADFWSQVLQAQSLKPLDFALGAVMATTRAELKKIGGFASLVDYLADDYQLGNRIVRNGGRIALSPVVVECCCDPMNWKEVWSHQLRWARTIRVCQPVPYFLSILNNATLWVLLFCCFGPPLALRWQSSDWGLSRHIRISNSLLVLAIGLGVRCLSAGILQQKLTCRDRGLLSGVLAPVYDLFRLLTWALSFIDNRITWRGNRFRVEPGGKLVKD